MVCICTLDCGLVLFFNGMICPLIFHNNTSLTNYRKEIKKNSGIIKIQTSKRSSLNGMRTIDFQNTGLNTYVINLYNNMMIVI